MARRRFGVALVLSGPVADEIDGLRRALGDPALGRIPPHLTLVPPVNVRDADVDAALAVLRDAAAATRPFAARLGPPATFLPTNPVVYLAVGAGAGADEVHRIRDRVFIAPLARDLTWPFVPHVTLADGIDPPRVEAALDALADYERDVTFDAVHLLEQQDERRWEVVADVPFSPRAVVGRGSPLELELTTTARLDDAARRWVDERWADPQQPLAVTARRGGVIVGIAAGWTNAALANLSELFVAPDARGEGIAGHLVAAFLSAAAERGALRCRLRADAGSTADALYRSRGFREEARYPGPAPDADIVQLVRDL